MEIRRFREEDAKEVSEVIRTTVRISNTKDYPADLMDELIASETPDTVLGRASWTHFYVVCDEGKIIGCGAIGPYWGKEDESSLFTIFVLPEYQGKGVGRQLIGTLENDEFFLRAKRIEIPASITGVPFYLKMGYHYKNGITTPDEEHLIRLEKYRDGVTNMIREIKENEIKDSVNVIRQSFQTVADEFGFTEENAPRFTAFATDEAKVLMWKNEQHRPMFGYFENGMLVGYYNLAFLPEGECELGSLCVLPDKRHSGIGEALLEDAVSRAKDLGFGKMKLSIVEENKVLRKWYEDHGFFHTGTEKYDFFPFTCGYLEKDL